MRLSTMLLVGNVAFASAFSGTEPAQECVKSYTRVFDDADGATQSDSYLTFTTFGRLSPYDDCKEWCLNRVVGCQAVNVYLDNHGKGFDAPDGFAAEFTCSAFSKPIDASMNTNRGGQDQHNDGILNFITKSAGFNLN